MQLFEIIQTFFFFFSQNLNKLKLINWFFFNLINFLKNFNLFKKIKSLIISEVCLICWLIPQDIGQLGEDEMALWQEQ